MARRQPRTDSTTSTDSTPEAVTVTAPDNQEDAVTTATVEPTEVPTDEVNDQTVDTTTEATEAAPAAPEPDLSNFESAVDAAVEASDPDTGTVPLDAASEVTKAYRELEGIKAKNRAKAYVNDKMRDAMNSADLGRARAFLNLGESALVAAAGSKAAAEKVPADPTEAFVQRVATLQLAYGLATQTVPEGVAEDWADRVNTLVSGSFGNAQAYQAYLANDDEDKGDEPEASAVVKNAVKLSAGKSAKVGGGSGRAGVPFTGERRDTGEHIKHAFSDVEDGTFLSIADIRNKKSPEYGDTQPSAGAISARLFPGGNGDKSSLVKFGIRSTTQDGKKGAVKDSSVAAAEDAA
jgi:hypothetical protein